MRENGPVLPVLSAYDGEIILEKGEILCEKRHQRMFSCFTICTPPNVGSGYECGLKAADTAGKAYYSSDRQLQ